MRELAHARLFRHARWLRLHLITAITAFARGIDIDTDRLEQLAEGFDPSNTEELRDAVVNGALIRPKSEEQQAALGRLETMLALVEGWVDAVTADATVAAARSPTRSPSRSAAAGRRADRPSRRSRRSSDSSCARAACARPPRCGARSPMPSASRRATRCGRTPTCCRRRPTSTTRARLVARLTGADTAESEADDEFDQALEQLLRGETPAAPGEDGEEPKA